MKIISLFLSIFILLMCLVGCSDNPTIDLEYNDDEFSSYPFFEQLASVFSSSSEESSSFVETSSEEAFSSGEEGSSAVADSSEDMTSSESTSSVPSVSIIDETNWNLSLVSPSHLLPEGYLPELAQINTKYASEGTQFDARAVDMLNQMCDAADEDGVWLWVLSAWRSEARQANNFKNAVNEVLSQNPDMPREEAEVLATTKVSKPGTSEHQLGLAVDFNSIDASFTESKHYAWLSEHAHEYGFIMRYTKEKQDITGVIYEPCHFRYVGVEHATAIKNSGLCLEEYLKIK